jgi:hypothetical protein
MLYQEVAIAEAPEHTDARDTSMASSLDIHIAVADVDGGRLPRMS